MTIVPSQEFRFPPSKHSFFDTPAQCISGRLAELDDRIKNKFRSMGGVQNLNVNLTRAVFPQFIFAADALTIFIPDLMLISPNDFPSDLQVNGPDDPKLNNEQFFDQISRWLAQTFHLEYQKATWRDLQVFKCYLRFMQNPEMARRALDFCLRHELVHILHDHAGQPKTDLKSRWTRFILWTAEKLIPICPCSGKAIDYLTSRMATKKLEWDADRTALQMTEDVAGAVYLFQTFQQQGKISRNDPQAPPSIRSLILSSGDYVPHIVTHQLFSDRIASLQAIH